MASPVSLLTKTLRFQLTLGETFFKSTSVRMMKSMIKALWCRFRKHLGCFDMLTPKAYCETLLFRNFSNQVFTICNFGIILAMTSICSSKIFKIWCRFQKWNKNLEKSFSFSRWLQLIWELKIRAILNRILGIGSQCVNKHP